MCRIAYIPNPKKVGSAKLIELFAYLEKTQGGDGNGMAFTRNDRIHTIKGVLLPTSLLADMAAQMDGPVLFHTRHGTIGGICDELCQPFVIDNTAFVHNGHWHSWDDAAMELLLSGDMDGHGPINDSLAAATLAIKRGRYSLEAIHAGVFVIMTPDKAWLHLRGGKFCFCESMEIYASDFPKDWPASKSIGDDAVAHLLPDGPEFECGGYWKPRTIIYYGGHYQQQKKAEDNEDSQEKTPKDLTDDELLQQLDNPSLRKFELEDLANEWERRYRQEEDLANEWAHHRPRDRDDPMDATPIEALTNHELRQQLDNPSLRKFEYADLIVEWEQRLENETIIENWRKEYGL